MTLPQRQRVSFFVDECWSDEDYEREESIGDDVDSMRPVDQSRLIGLLSHNMLNTCDYIKELIDNDKLLLMDQETMVPFHASGFYISEEGKIILFHPR